MTLNFQGDVRDLMPGIAALSEDMGFSVGAGGFPVEVRREGGGLRLDLTPDGARICCGTDRTVFFRALGRLIRHAGHATQHIQEQCAFATLGAMIDTSRNAVPTVATIQRFIRNIAPMGFNVLMLYMEDTFEIPGEPYFGYMRGRYTQEELAECDRYAAMFGIETIPCIQTLAHLPRALQWNCYQDIRDTPDILLADSPATYAFIRRMIEAAAAPFHSRRIHLGMDEAHFIGLGSYLTRHGPQDRFEILNRHLAAVKSICDELHLQPIVYSDMYYRLIDPTGDYSADHVPARVTARIPENVQLNYWDYFSTSRETYRKKLRQHEAIRKGTMFSGGIWTWNGFAVSYNRSVQTTLPALSVCRELGIRDVVATLWGDDGAETHFFQALLGLQMYAELAYGQPYDPARIGKRFRECTGGNPAAFQALEAVDNITADPRNDQAVNPSKLALYQDVMYGLFDRHLEGLNLSAHYARLAEQFRAYSQEPNRLAYLFRPIAQLCRLLSRKAELGIRLTAAYRAHDREKLGRIAADLKWAQTEAEQFRDDMMALCLRDFKPFGLEVLNIRLGGVVSRLEYASRRLADYLAGRIPSLPELEETRLYHDCRTDRGENPACRFNRWHQTVTTAYIGHNIP